MNLFNIFLFILGTCDKYYNHNKILNFDISNINNKYITSFTINITAL